MAAFETTTESSSNASPSYASCYVTAPTSPKEIYYSAPASPRRRGLGEPAAATTNPTSILADDLFEFETSKKFSGYLHFDDSTSDNLDYDPLPSMAFADELFRNGLLKPLKLPPRLQHDSSTKSSASSSPRTPFKIPPFARKNSSWNDDFDPFVAALQKVREEEEKEEKRSGIRSSRRRQRYSPFRAAVARCSSDCTLYCNNQDSSSGENSPAPVEPSGPLMAYKSPKRLLLGERVRPLRNDENDNDKCVKNKYCIGNNGEESQSKVQKLKAFLMRYALFGRGGGGGGNKQQTTTRSDKNKYSRLGFRFN